MTQFCFTLAETWANYVATVHVAWLSVPSNSLKKKSFSLRKWQEIMSSSLDLGESPVGSKPWQTLMQQWGKENPNLKSIFEKKLMKGIRHNSPYYQSTILFVCCLLNPH